MSAGNHIPPFTVPVSEVLEYQTPVRYSKDLKCSLKGVTTTGCGVNDSVQRVTREKRYSFKLRVFQCFIEGSGGHNGGKKPSGPTNSLRLFLVCMTTHPDDRHTPQGLNCVPSRHDV